MPAIDWSILLISMGAVVGGWGLLDGLKDLLTGESDGVVWGVMQTLLGISIILAGLLVGPSCRGA